jgi:hypothetical protein
MALAVLVVRVVHFGRTVLLKGPRVKRLSAVRLFANGRVRSVRPAVARSRRENRS